ncbi:MarR family winged helix-turn-helix transcriptional regulator [Streptomyces sp. NPDC058420]|uniref:MarR family winged helix-turn-helix transcriptional regulator n=1 Tax=Streptomyces sp. NPDC058420 TaxID=3346489 RepID=UPI003651ECAF
MASKSSRGPIDLPGFFADLVRCETRLYNALNDRLRERHGIVTSQYESLRFLRDHPRSRVADLATEFAIGIGASSKAVDRLEKQGWVARRTNPSDRRSSLLDLTAAGRRLIEAAEDTFTTTLSELTADILTGPSGAAAGHVLSELRAALEHDQIGLPTG